MRENWVADFETTNDPNDCRVWLWGARKIDADEFKWGTTIESFIKFICTKPGAKIWFHNLKFDAQFLISKLLTEGYKWTAEESRARRTFSTLIAATGEFYTLTVNFETEKKSCKVYFLDSLKLLRMSCAKIAQNFHLPFNKREIDYEKNRPCGYRPTVEEIIYVETDCLIVATALQSLFAHGMDGITVGQCAMNDFRKRKKNFSTYFPTLRAEVEEDIRQAYRGGFTYLNPSFRDIETGPGFFIDKNSMYPSVLLHERLPVGRPLFFHGKYCADRLFPLFIQKMSFSATLKPGKTPFLRSKNFPGHTPIDYIEDTRGEILTLTLTSPEISLLFENYEVGDLVYHSGWKFKAATNIFNDYITHWTREKEAAKKQGDAAKYQIAKMYLNSLIGKFGGRNSGRQKYPEMRDDGVVVYKTTGRIVKKSVYSPLALFVTAYARVDLVRTIQEVRRFGLKKYDKDVYIYSDTDSIGTTLALEDLSELQKIFELDNSKIGSWKVEKVFKNAKFLHSKCYMTLSPDNVSHATIAGLPENLANTLNFKDFKKDNGLKITNSKRAIQVKGGVVLVDRPFDIS